MINPTKASYSMAPTMMVCALAGFLTAKLFAAAAAAGLPVRRCRFSDRPLRQFPAAEPVAVGRLLPVLSAAFLIARNRQTFLQGLAFGVALLIGLAPTLVANAINAGSPFATTYGGIDVAPPELKPDVL